MIGTREVRKLRYDDAGPHRWKRTRGRMTLVRVLRPRVYFCFYRVLLPNSAYLLNSRPNTLVFFDGRTICGFNG